LENEDITYKIEILNDDNKKTENEVWDISQRLNDNFEIITLLEQGNTSELERTEVKLHLLEETLNRRSDK